jgi:hypothetical protein
LHRSFYFGGKPGESPGLPAQVAEAGTQKKGDKDHQHLASAASRFLFIILQQIIQIAR